MSPKEAAASFLKLAGGGKVREAYESLVAPEFSISGVIAIP